MNRLKEHIIARQTCLEYIKTKDEFMMKDLVADIISRGGLARVSLGVTITEYMQYMWADYGYIHMIHTKDDVRVIVYRDKLNNRVPKLVDL